MRHAGMRYEVLLPIRPIFCHDLTPCVNEPDLTTQRYRHAYPCLIFSTKDGPAAVSGVN